VSVVLPPLRETERGHPGPYGAFSQEVQQENKKNIAGVTAETRDLLMRYAYPGNVRELENIIERAVVLTKGEIITSADIPLHLKTMESEEKDLRCEARRFVDRDPRHPGARHHHGGAQVGRGCRPVRRKARRQRAGAAV